MWGNMKLLFEHLYSASCEKEVDNIFNGKYSEALNDPTNWFPLGKNESNFGVIENQQASPIGALIEKITNSIDAILMRHCLESNIDPRSSGAPQTMSHATELFFDTESKIWHLSGPRKKQAESIQILASGSRTNPCLVIYDDGEGQHPEEFENTFLSLLRGNKNEIPFVQGKYNMGGTGAVVFCGKHHYQLIASRRFDASGDLGFTIIRKHPFSEEEKKTKKNTWYEYLKIDNQIPRCSIDEIDIGLANRKFTTGTIIKLYDYKLPPGTRGGLPQEVRRAINQFLFEPALPIYLKDSPARYPNNTVLEGDCFGLKRRLENDENKYIQEHFTEDINNHKIGHMKATCYVFKTKVEGQGVKETKKIINREFFHDDMAVLFSLNGQVHGHLTPEFITRTLKMPLLKNHLLIHIDCTNLDYDFRHELFMASRDRLKGGEETTALRKHLAALLQKGRLTEIYKARKNAISVEGGDTKDLLRAFSKNLPFNKDLMKLLNQTFKIEAFDEKKKKKKDKPTTATPKQKQTQESFSPQRYPSIFNLKTGNKNSFISIPECDEKTIHFETDVEDNYFDRSEDPGELKITILQQRKNDTSGGNRQGAIDSPGKLIDISKSSPQEGMIRIGIAATSELKVGDEIEIKASLEGPEDLECRFWIKIVEPKKKQQEVKKEEKTEEPPVGLPGYELVYESIPEESPKALTWEKMEATGCDMDWDTVMHPLVDGEQQLETIYINMDSTVLRNYISKQGNIGTEQKEIAEKRYISSVYFHTIFLYSITKNKKYELKQNNTEVDIGDYLRDLFNSYYSDFLLNFGTEQLMASLED
jgi:hypothetical protein